MSKNINDGWKFRMNFINEYGHKTMLIIFYVLGYFKSQKKNNKPCYLTKRQIQDSMLGKVSFTTIKKAKKVLEHFFNIKTIKRDCKSLRDCKYEWVLIEKENNADIDINQLWSDLKEKIENNNKSSNPFKLFKFRVLNKWLTNMSNYWNLVWKSSIKNKLPKEWFEPDYSEKDQEKPIWIMNSRLNL